MVRASAKLPPNPALARLVNRHVVPQVWILAALLLLLPPNDVRSRLTLHRRRLITFRQNSFGPVTATPMRQRNEMHSINGRRTLRSPSPKQPGPM